MPTTTMQRNVTRALALIAAAAVVVGCASTRMDAANDEQLRADTAAVAALAVMQATIGNW